MLLVADLFTSALEFSVGGRKEVICYAGHHNECRQLESAESGRCYYFHEGENPSNPNSESDPDSQLPPIFTPLDNDTSTEQYDTSQNCIDTERQATERDPTQHQSNAEPLKLFDRIHFLLTHTGRFYR